MVTHQGLAAHTTSLLLVLDSALPLPATFCAHRDERASYYHGQLHQNLNNCDLKV